MFLVPDEVSCLVDNEKVGMVTEIGYDYCPKTGKGSGFIEVIASKPFEDYAEEFDGRRLKLVAESCYGTDIVYLDNEINVYQISFVEKSEELPVMRICFTVNVD